jgi:hypothetical protein
MNIMKNLLVGVAALLTTGSVSAQGGGQDSRRGYEEPEYEVVESLGDRLEIRRYGERLIAEASVPLTGRRQSDNSAFRLLFNYITGANTPRAEIAMTVPVEIETVRAERSKGEQIAMTVPVEMDTVDEKRVMRFFFPAGYTLANAPAPNDPRVTVTTMGAEIVASLRFSGTTPDARVAEKSAELLEALAKSDWRAVEEPNLWSFDDPFTLPFLRRNEVVVRVEKNEGRADEVREPGSQPAELADRQDAVGDLGG